MPKYGDMTDTNQKVGAEHTNQLAATNMAENFRMDTVELLNQVC